MHTRTSRLSVFVFLLAAVASSTAQLVPGEVLAAQKISATEGGFDGHLGANDQFGFALACPGDLNGDTVPDLFVGAPFDDVVLENVGTVWVLFPRRDGTIKAKRAINPLQGGFGGVLDAWDFFGWSVAAIGDLDGDGVTELAVGAPNDDDGGDPGDTSADRGAVWILFMTSTGTVKSQTKISQTEGGFGGSLHDGCGFGKALAAVGDLDGNGVPDLVVGSPTDDGAGPLYARRGAFWVLLLAADGTLIGQQRFAPAALDLGDWFGCSLAALGDVDGDGRQDLAVGAIGDDDGLSNVGAVWLCALLPDGRAETWGKITVDDPAFGGAFEVGDDLGSSLAALGDVDHDGVIDLAAGASGTGPGSFGTGAVWILHLDRQGALRAASRIGDDSGGLGDVLDPDDDFGSAVACLGDLDVDGSPDLAVGASRDGDGSQWAGAVWMLFLTDQGWLTLAGGLPGTHGIPALSGSGSLLAGDPFTLDLAGTRENAAVLWLAGLAELAIPFHGGVLVPAPEVVLAGAPSDASGHASATGVLPPGLGHGVAVWWQAWVADPLANDGWSGSNGVQAVTP
ncbi:MAG: FG-GAP repeat protein [Planctomycetes bacterium]|nr:FG-GAP repeat protein [Planctomycetota bacterium]